MYKNMTEGEKSRTTYACASVKLKDGTKEMWFSPAGKKGYVPSRIKGSAKQIRNKFSKANKINRYSDAGQTLMRETNDKDAGILLIGAIRDMCYKCQTVAKRNQILNRVTTPLKRKKRKYVKIIWMNCINKKY